MTKFQWTTAAAVMMFASTALAATPAEKCESDKNREAGKYVECLQRAEAKFALTEDGTALGRAIQKCADKYRAKWPAIESRADGSCPSTGDGFPIAQYLDIVSADVATAVAGGTLAAGGHRLRTGQTTCYAAVSPYGEIPCAGTGRDGEHQKGLDRSYADNGDGTITDLRTGLMWEKLSDDGSIHDYNSTTYTAANVAVKIAGLNGQSFAGYTDWRMPNVAELQTLVNYGARNPAVHYLFHGGCTPGCTIQTCSCTSTASSGYLSSSVVDAQAPKQWAVVFHDGHVAPSPYTNGFVRAVRGGS
jgi:hypothetical protein